MTVLKHASCIRAIVRQIVLFKPLCQLLAPLSFVGKNWGGRRDVRQGSGQPHLFAPAPVRLHVPEILAVPARSVLPKARWEAVAFLEVIGSTVLDLNETEGVVVVGRRCE